MDTDCTSVCYIYILISPRFLFCMCRVDVFKRPKCIKCKIMLHPTDFFVCFPVLLSTVYESRHQSRSCIGKSYFLPSAQMKKINCFYSKLSCLVSIIKLCYLQLSRLLPLNVSAWSLDPVRLLASQVPGLPATCPDVDVCRLKLSTRHCRMPF